MVRKIRKLLRNNQKKNKTPTAPATKSREFTFMLTQNGIGKSIRFKSADRESAEKELKEKYPNHEVQFLWEW